VRTLAQINFNLHKVFDFFESNFIKDKTPIILTKEDHDKLKTLKITSSKDQLDAQKYLEIKKQFEIEDKNFYK
jgi:hypothetical protein